MRVKKTERTLFPSDLEIQIRDLKYTCFRKKHSIPVTQENRKNRKCGAFVENGPGYPLIVRCLSF